MVIHLLDNYFTPFNQPFACLYLTLKLKFSLQYLHPSLLLLSLSLYLSIHHELDPDLKRRQTVAFLIPRDDIM